MVNVLSVESSEFKAYGRIVDNVDFSPLLEQLQYTPVSKEVVYEPSVKELEDTSTFDELSIITYGEMPIQIGYCNGYNSMLNALEYHKDSEVNVMATDAILLLGLRSEIEDDFTYDTSKVKAFLVPKGTAVEIYATSLHYAPCGVNGEKFQVAIVLPRGTNYPCKIRANGSGEDRLLAASNKWLIGHPNAKLGKNVFRGLKGENLSIL